MAPSGSECTAGWQLCQQLEVETECHKQPVYLNSCLNFESIFKRGSPPQGCCRQEEGLAATASTPGLQNSWDNGQRAVLFLATCL